MGVKCFMLVFSVQIFYALVIRQYKATYHFSPLTPLIPLILKKIKTKNVRENQNKIWFGFVELVYGILLWSLEL